jgi:hypothetical protein
MCKIIVILYKNIFINDKIKGMNSIMSKINKKSKDIIEDNNFLFAAFENRLLTRMVHIFEKRNIPINKDMLKKKMEENLINNLMDQNVFIVEKYVKLVSNYEKIIWNYVETKADTDIIKKSTMEFVKKLSEKNKTIVTKECANNFKEYINSIIYVYDNFELNNEVFTRIESDTFEIVNEFNKNNYNFVIESINEVIKNIINKM